ncbi:hypothetical protein BSL78_15327 [Apostichopus japonicus]|uniref:Phosphoglycerate kinase n=1 Tax=Stichopus japonicus TaxID=307972 RepID=A0A2G8KIJ8_STIJA|nr:hypothetical protein BSL78_15327 [Apostichopus japonicus]
MQNEVTGVVCKAIKVQRFLGIEGLKSTAGRWLGAAQSIVHSLYLAHSFKKGLDCGPKSLETFQAVISKAKLIVWNGTMLFVWLQFHISFSSGLRHHSSQYKFSSVTCRCFEFENLPRHQSSDGASLQQKGTTTIIGGGDTATCAAKWGTEDKVSHVSTGGGASLELLEGKILPGVAALTDA